MGVENGVVLQETTAGAIVFFDDEDLCASKLGCFLAFGKRRWPSVVFLAFFPTVASVVFAASFLVFVSNGRRCWKW
jgi:hypothetical protein